MPECHTCPYNGQGHPRCTVCRGPSDKPHNHGLNIVSMETLPEKEVANIRSREHTTMAKHTDKLTVFMHRWLRLPSKTRDLLAILASDPSVSIATFARKNSVSKQAVHQRLDRLFKKYPSLEPILYIRIKRIKRMR